MIYVDVLVHHGLKIYNNYVKSCHMISSNGLDDLHKMAENIGLKRSWFHQNSSYPHYDLTGAKRKMAVQMGAVELSSKEFVKLVLKLRKQDGK